MLLHLRSSGVASGTFQKSPWSPWDVCDGVSSEKSCRFDKLFILMERSFDDLLTVRLPEPFLSTFAISLQKQMWKATLFAWYILVQVSQLCASVGQGCLEFFRLNSK